MWLRRCSRFPGFAGSTLRGSVLALMLLAFAGCASGPDSRPAKAGNAGSTESVPPAAQKLFEQAVSAMASGDLPEAELRFEEFVLQYPDYPGAHVNLAIIHAKNGDDQAAEDSLTDALIIDPAHAPALNQLGMLLRRQGKFSDAESAYLRAVDADPEYAIAHYNLGVLNELYLQRLDKALSHYEMYQSQVGGDERVDKWIVDLKRRLESIQRAANVTE